MPKKTDLADLILDKALELAEGASWEALRLHAVADALQITMDEIRRHYPQKDDLVEAWFDRADRAVLDQRPSDDFRLLAVHTRLHRVMMTWLDALSPHRRLTRQMLMYKLEPGHVHLQILGVMRISRTVQWFREAACLDTTDFRRIVEEVSLTTIYLATFTRWMFDDSQDSRATRTLLERLLSSWDRCGNTAKRFFCRPSTSTDTDSTPKTTFAENPTEPQPNTR